MNSNYMYSNYQGNNFRSMPTRTDMSASYSDNILMMHQGKNASFYVSLDHSNEWRDIIFKGTIEGAGKDYTLIKDSTTGNSILIWNDNIDYVIFDQDINA